MSACSDLLELREVSIELSKEALRDFSIKYSLQLLHKIPIWTFWLWTQNLLFIPATTKAPNLFLSKIFGFYKLFFF